MERSPTSDPIMRTPRRQLALGFAAAALVVAASPTASGASTPDGVVTAGNVTAVVPDGRIGGFTTAKPMILTPGPPMVLEGSRLRPASRTELDQLVARTPKLAVQGCVVDFDDDDAIALLGGAAHTFVVAPWWNQVCDDSWVRVHPTTIDHFHLTYADPDITNCLNPDNEYGTPLGEIARGADECEPIDPVTEPRGFAHSMFDHDIIAIDRIKLGGFDYSPQPFTFERIKVVDAGLRVCFRLEPDGPWEAAAPPGPGDHPAQYCWPSLTTGTWDLSAYTSGAIGVTVTSNGDGAVNYGLDDLWLSW